MRLDFKNIIPEALYSVSMAKRLLGIGQTTIYEYMKKCPPVLPYQRSKNGWHRLILGSDIISLKENPQVKRGRRRKAQRHLTLPPDAVISHRKTSTLTAANNSQEKSS